VPESRHPTVLAIARSDSVGRHRRASLEGRQIATAMGRQPELACTAYVTVLLCRPRATDSFVFPSLP
jgi:hypothetical protein